MSANAGRPFVGVIAAGEAPPELRDDVLWGLEEEGVPALLLPPEGDQAVGLAQRAAHASPLGLGIGLDACGSGAVWHLAVTAHPYVHLAGPIDSGQARLLGSVAGRLAKRRPLPGPVCSVQ